MNKLSRFTSYGIEDDEVVTKDGDTEVVVTAEPPKDTEEQKVTEDTPPIETANVDLEPKDDSEEAAEEKEKKIKIEIEIAQEQISQMTDAITSLETICDQMKDSLQRGGLGVQGRMIAKTSVQHIVKQFNLEQTKTSSLESYGYQIDDFHATQISIEGIVDKIKAILARIVKFFGDIIAYISNKLKSIKLWFVDKFKKKKEEIKTIKYAKIKIKPSLLKLRKSIVVEDSALITLKNIYNGYKKLSAASLIINGHLMNVNDIVKKFVDTVDSAIIGEFDDELNKINKHYSTVLVEINNINKDLPYSVKIVPDDEKQDKTGLPAFKVVNIEDVSDVEEIVKDAQMKSDVLYGYYNDIERRYFSFINSTSGTIDLQNKLFKSVENIEKKLNSRAENENIVNGALLVNLNHIQHVLHRSVFLSNMLIDLDSKALKILVNGIEISEGMEETVVTNLNK